jgi:hypothetical protein
MKAILTPSVIRFLVINGYRYCLSKTSEANESHAAVRITLTPVKSRPSVWYQTQGYDTCFSIMHEPLQMAREIHNTQVLINLEDHDLKGYNDSISFV